MNFDRIIESETVFWEQFYRDTLDLPDWEERVERRINLLKGTAEKPYYLPKNFNFSDVKVLDAGCGTGQYLVDLFRTSSAKMDLFGLDVDDRCLQLAKTKLSYFTDPSVQFGLVQSPLGQCSFSDEVFDLIHCEDVLEHVENPTEAMKELWRILAPGGYLYIHVPDYRWIREPHYNIRVFPNQKWLVRLLLRIYDRPTEYFEELNFLSPKIVEDFLSKRDSVSQIKRIYPNYESIRGKLISCISRVIGLKYDLLIQKRGTCSEEQ